MTQMLGTQCPRGPGGRDCSCCGDAPGKPRKQRRRNVKRTERQAWQREVRNG